MGQQPAQCYVRSWAVWTWHAVWAVTMGLCWTSPPAVPCVSAAIHVMASPVPRDRCAKWWRWTARMSTAPLCLPVSLYHVASLFLGLLNGSLLSSVQYQMIRWLWMMKWKEALMASFKVVYQQSCRGSEGNCRNMRQSCQYPVQDSWIWSRSANYGAELKYRLRLWQCASWSGVSFTLVAMAVERGEEIPQDCEGRH